MHKGYMNYTNSTMEKSYRSKMESKKLTQIDKTSSINITIWQILIENIEKILNKWKKELDKHINKFTDKEVIRRDKFLYGISRRN